MLSQALKDVKFNFDVTKPEKIGNLARYLKDDERKLIGADVIALVDTVDEKSAEDWYRDAQRYLEEFKKNATRDDNATEEAASDETSEKPSLGLVMQAVTTFNGRAIDQLVGDADFIKPTTANDVDKALADWASNDLRTNDKNWLPDLDLIALHTGVVGMAWRKTDIDRRRGVLVSSFRPFNAVIVSADAASVEKAPRVTDKMRLFRHEVDHYVASGEWLEPMLEEGEEDPQAPAEFYDCHTWLDLDDDGINEPWRVTVSKKEGEVIAIWPRWASFGVIKRKADEDTGREEGVTFDALQHFQPYPFLPDPDGGFHALGYGWALEKYEKVTGDLLSNFLSITKKAGEDGGVLTGVGYGLPETIQLKRNIINQLTTDGRSLADNFSWFPDTQIPAALPQAIEMVLKLADRASGGINTLREAPASMSATMASGIIQNDSLVASAIYRRMHMAMTEEVRNRVKLAKAYNLLPPQAKDAVHSSVALTADPAISTEILRTALVQYYAGFLEDPMTDPQELRLRMHRLMRVPNPEKLVRQPPPPQMTPFEEARASIEFLRSKAKDSLDQSVVAKNYAQAATLVQQIVADAQAMALELANFKMGVESMTQGGTDGQGGPGGPASPSGSVAAGPGNGSAPQLPGASAPAANGALGGGGAAPPGGAGSGQGTQ